MLGKGRGEGRGGGCKDVWKGAGAGVVERGWVGVNGWWMGGRKRARCHGMRGGGYVLHLAFRLSSTLKPSTFTFSFP